MKRIEGILHAAAKSLFENLDQFWPTRPGWDVAEANLIAHLHTAASTCGARAYLEVPLQVAGESGKRIDLLILPNDPDLSVAWVEAKRIYKNNQATTIYGDLQRLLAPDTQLGEHLPDALHDRPVMGVFLALTHRADVANWWAEPNAPAPFNDPLWGSISVAIADAERQVFRHQAGPPRPSFVLTARWQRRTV